MDQAKAALGKMDDKGVQDLVRGGSSMVRGARARVLLSSS